MNLDSITLSMISSDIGFIATMFSLRAGIELSTAKYNAGLISLEEYQILLHKAGNLYAECVDNRVEKCNDALNRYEAISNIKF